MRATSKGPPISGYRDEVTDRIEAGQPFHEVEKLIELAEATEDQKAALWLLAFSVRERRQDKRDPNAYAGLVTEL